MVGGPEKDGGEGCFWTFQQGKFPRRNSFFEPPGFVWGFWVMFVDVVWGLGVVRMIMVGG